MTKKIEADIKLDECQKTVMNALKQAGITSVELRYHGDIEEGSVIDALEVTPPHMKRTLQQTRVIVDNSPFVLTDAIVELHERALSAAGFPNYQEGAGGEGWMVIDVEQDNGVPPGISLQHSAYKPVRQPLFQRRHRTN